MEELFNPFTLKGKNILITGSSSGIGRQCAIDCSKMGARVVLVARNEERLKETMSDMASSGHSYFCFDLNNLDRIKDFINEVVARNGKFDGLVHAAGIEKTSPSKLLLPSDYEEIIRANTLSGFELTRNIMSAKHFNTNGSIIFLASISALIGRNGLAAYAASKGAIISAVKVYALELSNRNIRVNAISPGTILTPMMRGSLSNMTEEAYKNRIEGFPLGLGSETDISNAVIYLLSNASRWITGQNIVIDGGYTIR